MRVSKECLKKGAVEILISLGDGAEGAERAADCLTKADMRGVSTHGTYLLKTIAERVKAGMLTLPTKPEFIMNDGATALIDGKDGLGPIAAYLAMETSIAKTKEFGVSAVMVRNTNNIGSLAYYTQFANKQNMVAIMACNAAPAMAPWGGAEALVGTNPIAIAIPTGKIFCFSADMASSVVARGKIRKAARQNKAIPDNWAIDADGNPTTDPNAALKGTLLPMGGPKGSAISLAIDIIAGLISGSKFGSAVKSFHTPEGQTGVGVFCITIDVNRFMAADQFEDLIKVYIMSAKSMNKAIGFTEILMPGEIELRKEQSSVEQGIDLDEQTIIAIDALLTQIGSKTKLEAKYK
jgi:LDH2 family malate/lactate/ureidoglycolate dehydrogenase